MSNDLHRLVYCSRSALGAGEESACEAVVRILEVSRANNTRFGITGALLFSAGCFAQVLEGPLPALERTFERIQRDRRHCNVTMLQIGRLGQRAFGDWSMAFAGDPRGAHPLASTTVNRAFSITPTEAGREVLNTLEQLVQSEESWVAAA